MQGTLQIKCIACGEDYRWLKVSWTRPDGYPDWDLHVSCKCGRCEDPIVIQRAFADFRIKQREKVIGDSNNFIDKMMGTGANDVLERMLRERSEK